MAKPDFQNVHLVVLQEPSFYRPQDWCLFVGDDTSADKALEQAIALNKRYEVTKGITFVERTDQPATLELNCFVCNERQLRDGRLLK